MKITLTNSQYSALMDIYGPPENVHLMIMSSSQTKSKILIEGDDNDFEDLLSTINEDISEGLCPKRNITALLEVCKKIDPASLDWIGM